MKKEYTDQEENANVLREEQSAYGFVNESEDERLLRDVLRPGIEKLQLFTKSLKRNAMLTQIKPKLNLP